MKRDMAGVDGAGFWARSGSARNIQNVIARTDRRMKPPFQYAAAQGAPDFLMR